MPNKKVLVCGSRSWTDYRIINNIIRKLPANTTIIEGGAIGADSIAGNSARLNGFKVITIPADWDTHGRSAGIIRNIKMLEMKPSEVIAFIADRTSSPGTQHTIREAKKRNIPVRIIHANEPVQLEHSEIWLDAHPSTRCVSQPCALHNRTDHSMRKFPQLWRGDRKIIERICPCGVGHPDPDDPTTDRVHGCCGIADHCVPTAKEEQ